MTTCKLCRGAGRIMVPPPIDEADLKRLDAYGWPTVMPRDAYYERCPDCAGTGNVIVVHDEAAEITRKEWAALMRHGSIVRKPKV